MDVEMSDKLSEAVIVKRGKEEQNVNMEDNTDSNGASSVLESNKRKMKDLEGDESFCVINIKGIMSEDLETEVVCRICHLSSDPSSDSPKNYFSINMEMSNLVRLGCACRGELGNAHPYCLETWFKLKGNRQCEICGENAKNVKGVGDFRCTEESNEIRSGSTTRLSETANAYWRGQTLCNLLMACLVIAFVLPWFFRVKLF